MGETLCLRSGVTERENQRSIMGATRTIRRAAVVTACLTLLGACRSDGKHAGHRASAPPPKGVASQALAHAFTEKPTAAPTKAPLAPAVAQTLRSLREQRLEIAPPTVQSTLLSFGTGRLLQASLDKATFRDSARGEVIAEASVGTVRAVAHGVDGSLFAIGASSGVLLPPRVKAAKRFPRVTFLPGSQLLPDLEAPSHFFVYYPEEPQLYWYSFDGEPNSSLAIEASFAFEGCLEPIVQLRDAAIVCRTKRGFLRQAPRGRRTEFTFPPSDDPPVRLLPAKRIDEFFAVSRAGEVLHLRLAGGLDLLARFRLPAPAYAASANAEALAFILVTSPQSGQARRWSLLVTDFDGQARFETDLLAAAPSAEEDWLAAMVEDKNLAISAFEPLVAVGGARRVVVWDYAQARELFSR
jgi:hypothetical protein